MSIVSFLHQFKLLRNLAKLIGKRINISQRFHNGVIYLNAVEHSWAWTGDRNYTDFDAQLQDFIHAQSINYDCFVDIGSNLGVMTLGTLLKNKNIQAIAIDPNTTAIKLLKKSLKANRLENRCQVMNAVVSNNTGSVRFDDAGSVTGHVSGSGEEVASVSLSGLLNKITKGKTLVKIDTEGYETVILTDLSNVNNLQNFTLLIETHPLGFNGAGNPAEVYLKLNKHGYKLYDLQGVQLTALPAEAISQVLAIHG